MARGDGVNRTNARNVNLTLAKVGNTQRHNEREKDAYTNSDIVEERTCYNVHFKMPTGSYKEMFSQMEEAGTISTRGLKEDANLFGELVFDVNSAYFYNHGGYEFAKEFYENAYRAAIDIVGGEQYILSAVMHADERNRAMSDALGKEVYHYHLHVVYVPVVEKQILWSKRCKDKSLVGTVKETIMQVSSSKKWLSKPARDEGGNTILQKNGKPVLRKSYSVLQDDFFQAICKAGYEDVERGERGSTEEHLTVTQFKVEQEQARLEQLIGKVDAKKQTLQKVESKIKVQNNMATSFEEIDKTGRKTFTGKIELTKQEAGNLKELAKESLVLRGKVANLQDDLKSAKHDGQVWRKRYEKLAEQTNDFVSALKKAPEMVRTFIDKVLHMELEKQFNSQIRERTLVYSKDRESR